MKYLKRFESYESDDIRTMLMDILQDINDYSESSWRTIVYNDYNNDYRVLISPVDNGYVSKINYKGLESIKRAIGYMHDFSYKIFLCCDGDTSETIDIGLSEITDYSLFARGDDESDYFEIIFQPKESINESQNQIDIYDFHRMLLNNSNNWFGNEPHVISDLKFLSDKFIGPGIYDKVCHLVDKIFDSLELVDIKDIKDRVSDILDEYTDSSNSITKCVLYGDINRYHEDIQLRFNGAIFINNDRKERIVCKILYDMMRPTLWFGSPNKKIRVTNDEIYVNKEIYQCCNFDVNNYELLKDKSCVIRANLNSKYTEDINKLRKYDINNFFDKPAIYISIKSSLNVKEIEKKYDDILPSILYDIDYEDVVWDYYRIHRKFDSDFTSDEYALKILLKI